MERSDRDVDGFLDTLPADVRDDIKTLDREISRAMAGHPRTLFTGKMWGGTDQEIVGYGVDRYVRSDKKQVEWFVVGLAAQSQYISLYVNAVEGRKYLAETHGKDLGKVKVGKSSISFKSIDDIDLEKLRALLDRAREIFEAKG